MPNYAVSGGLNTAAGAAFGFGQRPRQSFWPWIAGHQARGVCRHVYARAGRGAVAVFEVEDNDTLHRILNEWADIIPAHFDTYPLIEGDAARRMLGAQMAGQRA